MKGHYKILAFASCFFLGILGPINNSFAQGAGFEFSNEEDFFDFLQNQGEINGLNSYLLIEPRSFTNDSIGSLFILNGDKLVSRTFKSFDSTRLLANRLDLEVGLADYLGFTIYEEESSVQAAQEFVTKLLTSEDIFPVRENFGRDYVGLASRQQYQPVFTEGFGFFTSFKIFMVTVIITLFFVMALLMILFMLLFKSRRNKKEQLKSKYEAEISDPLAELLFEWSSDEISSISEHELERFFPSKNRAKKLYTTVLSDQIIRLNKKLRGDSKNKLKALFKRLELQRNIRSLLDHRQWDSKVSALVLINEMALKEFLPEVKSYVNSSNFYIRSQAANTILHLSEDVNLSFLKGLNYPLSDWQQMKLLRTIKLLYPERKLEMRSLFLSDNKSVRGFGIKLVRYLGRMDFLEQLTQMAPDVSSEEQVEIIETFQSLGAPLDLNLIALFMKSDTVKVRLAMSSAVGTVGDDSCLPFLFKGLDSETSFDIKRALLSSMKLLNEGSYAEFGHISDDPEVIRIQEHLDHKILMHV